VSILFLFLSLYIGINIRVSIILGIIEALILLGFIFYRFSLKLALVSLGTILIGVSLSFIRPNFVKDEYKCLVTEVKENYFIVSSTFEKMYVSYKNQPYEVGDILCIKGTKKELDFAIIESGFDFKNYLNNKGIYNELVPSKIDISFSCPFRIFTIKKQFLANFDADTASLVSLILFGNNIEGETSNMFRDLQLIRIISNTGGFLHLIFTLIVFLFSFLMKDKYSKLTAIFLIGIYSIFTYPRFVVIKFVILQLCRWINEFPLKKKFSYLELISFTGICFLLFDYHLAYQDSFLLTYLIPILVLFYNCSFLKMPKFKKKILITVLIFINFIPFSLKFNNDISLLSLPFQFILMPLTSLFGIGSMICFLGIPMYQGMNGFCRMLKNMLSFLSPVFIKIYAPPMSTTGTLIFEMMIISIVYFLSIGLKDVYKKIIPFFTIIFIAYCLPIKKYINTTVTFINVGQGDSCLISYKNQTILIDTGGSKYKDYATDCLIPFFKKKQIYRINCLITTHDDTDHSGAVSSLASHFKVDNYIKDYTKFPLSIGNITIENLNSFSSLWEDDNDKSLVLYFTVNDTKYLLMGDAPKKIEKEIINEYQDLDVDVLKVGHHGSNTSTDETFIETITPKEAVISCGKNNYYGHPHQETISILKKYNVKIRRTDKEGSVVYTS